MRALLLGTDFIYNSNGELVPIEINTNLGMDPIILGEFENVFDLSQLSLFIGENNFTNIIYVGSLDYFSIKLSELCDVNNINYEYRKITIGSLTVPYIEDTDNLLVIRSSYDVTAVVDEEYCKNKVNFLNLIKEKSFGTEFAYMDEYGTIISNISSIEDNGNHPNFILKAVYPNYDRKEYPKLYKVKNLEELGMILSNVDINYFLMKFHCNLDKKVFDYLPIIRSYNMIFPPDLKSVTIGKYIRVPNRFVDELSSFNDSTFEIISSDRNKYITSDQKIQQPKLLDTDQVEMSDGTFKYAIDLNIGDIVKTVKIYNPNNVNLKSASANYHISYNEFISGSTYSSNEIIGKRRLDVITNYVKIKFTDGTEWEDTKNSSYLSLRNDDVFFLHLGGILPGDKIILVDTNYKEFTTVIKEVSEVVNSKFILSGWLIGVKEEHVFLTKTEGEISQNFVAIEHNDACGVFDKPYCNQGDCSSKTGTYSCLSTANPGCVCL